MIILLALALSTANAETTGFIYPLEYDVAVTQRQGAATVVSVSKKLNLFSVSRHVWKSRDSSKPLLNSSEKLIFCSEKQDNDYCLIRSPETPAQSYAKFFLGKIGEKAELYLHGNSNNLGIQTTKGHASILSKDSYFFHCIENKEGSSGGAIVNSSMQVVAINVGYQQNDLACPGQTFGGRGVSAKAIFEELSTLRPDLLNEFVFEYE